MEGVVLREGSEVAVSLVGVLDGAQLTAEVWMREVQTFLDQNTMRFSTDSDCREFHLE